MYVHPMSCRRPDVFTTRSTIENPVAEPQLVHRHSSLAGIVLENGRQEALREEEPWGPQHSTPTADNQQACRPEQVLRAGAWT